MNGMKFSEDDNTIVNKLTKLSGRKFLRFENGKAIYKNISSLKPIIRRISQEYTHMAYKLRNQASHPPEDDPNFNNLFAGYNAKFTKEDAAISINLIVPLIQDYINYMKRN